jgi:UDP-3-O-[3-hydroxymyristoyl] glucosamine N-acyltransferase
MAGDPVSLSLADIAERLGGEILGDATVRVTQVATLANARADELSFLTNSKYRPLLASTGAGAVVLDPKDRDATGLPRIIAPNPYAYVARALALLNPPRRERAGVHPTASIAASAHVDPSAYVGPHAVVGSRARIGAGCQVGAGCFVGDDSTVDEDTVLYPQVTIYHGCTLGKRVIVHGGAVIGADGFGFAPDGGQWVKIPQIGGVVIGDDVEIGANTTIDRGALDDTVIEEGVKLDNLIQIAHNVRVGAHTVMAACAGVSGSTTIGKHCVIAGSAGIVGHVSIADNTTISAATVVTKSISEPGVYTAVLSAEPHRDWLKVNARLRNLNQMAERIRDLEQKVQELERNKP